MQELNAALTKTPTGYCRAKQPFGEKFKSTALTGESEGRPWARGFLEKSEILLDQQTGRN
jgi:hypothetical protein